MSEWITDRKPRAEDGIEGTVLAFRDGKCILAPWDYASYSDLPWMPIAAPEPYVKPKRWKVTGNLEGEPVIIDTHTNAIWATAPTHEAAERIAAIYEEVMP